MTSNAKIAGISLLSGGALFFFISVLANFSSESNESIPDFIKKHPNAYLLLSFALILGGTISLVYDKSQSSIHGKDIVSCLITVLALIVGYASYTVLSSTAYENKTAGLTGSILSGFIALLGSGQLAME
jgi:uncharacterized membrane protein